MQKIKKKTEEEEEKKNVNKYCVWLLQIHVFKVGELCVLGGKLLFFFSVVQLL